jgi:hypothetical protein
MDGFTMSAKEASKSKNLLFWSNGKETPRLDGLCVGSTRFEEKKAFPGFKPKTHRHKARGTS